MNPMAGVLGAYLRAKCHVEPRPYVLTRRRRSRYGDERAARRAAQTRRTMKRARS